MGLKILHAIASVNPAYGGPIEHVMQIARVHRSHGNSVEIVSLDSPSDPWVADCKVRCHAVGPGLGKYRYTPRLISWLEAHVSTFDVVIVNGIWNYISFGVWLALRGSTVPYFVFAHGMLDPYFRRQYPLKHLKKCLYWPWAEYNVLRNAKAVFFTSEEEMLLARQSFWPYHCNEYLVNYGTGSASGDAEQQREAFLTRFPHLRGKRSLLFLGRVHEKKGIDLTLKGLAQCIAETPISRTTDVHLIIAGANDNKHAAEIKALAKKLGLEDRITWTGMLSGDLKWGAFHASDAFVLNSHQENFGIAVVEALSAGLPTLITNKINIWREIEQAHAGFVDRDDTAGAARLLNRWLTAPHDEWADMRIRARDCFNSRFHVGATLQCLENAFATYGIEYEATRRADLLPSNA
ncbi:glycosyltransferase involved in cell wall biosynthesis [Trinickia symbiotica]|nr:glycosyltransferase [Trinickia symbiotica]PPK43028.1 glycosyltransferase involved in cell wall biosynthesis [Trinickia symbiotica]